MTATETARTRLAWVLNDRRLVMRYFREQPRIALRAFVSGPIVHGAVCSWRGHTRGGNVSRLLGTCDRCGADYPDRNDPI